MNVKLKTEIYLEIFLICGSEFLSGQAQVHKEGGILLLGSVYIRSPG